MFRKHTKNGTRSNRDSGVASMSSLHSVLDYNTSCRSFYKIHDLTVREVKYVKMLQTLVEVYRRHFTLALDPHQHSLVDLTHFRRLCGQERRIFFFYDRLLSLHRVFCDLLWECEDAIDVGRVFINWIHEDNLDIYIKHWLLNPLRFDGVQREFDAFMSKCMENVEIMGLDAYTTPGIHLFHYRKILSSLCEICTSNEDLAGLDLLQRSLASLNLFLERYNMSTDALEIENSQVDFSLIGQCVCRGEFPAREYAEGLKEKVCLSLFQRGLIVTTPRKSGKTYRQIFHSFCDLQHIDINTTDETIRLKDFESGRTYYRIKKRLTLHKKNKGVSIKQFIETVATLKQDEMNSSRISWSDSHPGVEAINHALIHRMRFRTYSLKHYGLSPQSIPFHVEENAKHVETFNMSCIERFILQEPSRKRELCELLRDKMKQFERFQEIDRERQERSSIDFSEDYSDCDSGSHSNHEDDEEAFYSARESLNTSL